MITAVYKYITFKEERGKKGGMKEGPLPCLAAAVVAVATLGLEGEFSPSTLGCRRFSSNSASPFLRAPPPPTMAALVRGMADTEVALRSRVKSETTIQSVVP